MPFETITDRRVFVHCPDPLCRGNSPRPVTGLAVETSWTFSENGGSLPGVERSSFTYRVKEEADSKCRVCGNRVEVSDQPRPIYENLSGVPASESLSYFGTFKPTKERTEQVDAELERLEDVIRSGQGG